ncbi:hypothetical protein [Marinicellulosiphila megalodicopiae]|uniref:hypothetical protein n=1 Tax=Marinicellulosiphila megalodicopiae TaxID=2724896 RepID=UPI003BB166CC
MNSSKTVKVSSVLSHKKKLSKQEEQFNKNWKKVQSLEKRNQKLKIEVVTFSKTVMSDLAQTERESQAAIISLITQLLTFAGRKSLSKWEKETLFLWIKENIEMLYANPMTDHKVMQNIQKQYMDTVKNYYDPEGLSDLQDQQSDEESLFDDVEGKDSFENNFDEMAKRMAEEMGVDVDAIKEEFSKQFGDDFFDKDSEINSNKDVDTDKIFKKSSINKMFKKIASVIHPDKATTAEDREKFHDVMSVLSTARDNNDVLTIFSLFDEYVGQSAFDIIDGDISQINELLKKRIDTLNDEKQQIIYENPIHGAVYSKFKKATKAKTQKEIDEYKIEITNDIEMYEMFLNQVTSLKKLKPILEEKYYRTNAFY